MKIKHVLLITTGVLLIGLLVACGNTHQDEDSAESNEKETPIVDGLTKEKIAAIIEKTENMAEQIKEKEAEEKELKQTKTKEKKKKTSTSSNDAADETKETQATKEAEEKKQTTKQAVSEASGTYYVTAPSLNVRSGGGTNYQVLGAITENTEVTVTGKTESGWYEFTFNDQKGYVSGNYLSEQKQVATKKETSPNEKESTSSDPKPSTPSNVVDQMKTIDHHEQVILVTTNGYQASTGQVRTFEKNSSGTWTEVMSATAYVGKNGFADQKVEGDGKTPTGKYAIGHAFGYEGNPGTKLSFKTSTANDVWVDDSTSAYYNTWQTDDLADKDWDSAENMMHRLYNYGFVINYNTDQVPDKGSAIFMHVGTSYTLGCVATDQSSLLDIMTWIDPAKNPVIIQTPESGLGNY